MFIETLEFTIPVELCNVFSTLQKGQRSNVEFPASVNSYGTTQDASVQVVLRSNKLTFKVDGVSSNASMISKSECKTLKLSVFDVDRTLMPQENDNYDSNNMSAMQHSTPVSFPSKRHQEISVSQPPAKNRRTSFSESPRPRSPLHRRSQPQISPRPSQNTQSKSKNDSPVNVKQEPEDPDLIEIELDHDPDDVVPKKETPYMQIDYSSDVPHTQTSQAALDRLSHPQSSHSQSPGSSSSSFHQNVPHVPDYAEPSTSQVHHGDQSADDFLVFQEQDEDCDDNDADYGNDGCGSFPKVHTSDYLPVGDQTYGSHLGSFSEQLSYPQGSGMLQMGSFQGLLSSRGHVELPGSSVNSSLLFESPTPGKAKRKRTACPVCNRLFSDQRAMLYHKESAHEDKVFPCECGKVYKHKPNLMAHAKRCGYRLTFVQKVD
ncbi:uncharacterized protein LOC124128726 isoform X6 [Haliotis rufescens]|uniref:uncharacterized protein LOC124128726 isoform X6 n=1 Tax=Haliotis rufescens TaxID=6454 RepID=UPI00201FA272|nr:uncharacterized protein LOC124128726 isoform X6 [Haliotis rufescens]